MTSPGKHRKPLITAACAAALALALAGGGPISPAPALAAPGPGITITPNPWYASEPFEGWGTSLVWFANAIGTYPDELRQELYDLVFTEEGLDLTVARYNVGGGNSTDTPSYLRPGGAVPGYWAPDPTGALGLYDGVSTAYADRANLAAIWDPDDPTHFDWTQDAGQRWWLEQLAEDGQLTALEAFANSAPYFLTSSGYTSGGTSSTAENLPVTALDQFAGYLVKVVEHLEDQYGIEFDTIDPFNEPNTNYWSTTLTNGVPTGGRQEGMHVGTARQAAMITALGAALEGAETDAVISAMDETNPGTFLTNWNSYSAAVKELVGQMNVHTYGTGSRPQVMEKSKYEDKSLYMSEIEGDWAGSGGFNPRSMANALGLAGRIADDLRELEPDAWVLWQPVEDLYNMDGTYDDSEDLNWGSLYIDFDCQYYGAEIPENFKSARRVAQSGGDPSGVEPCHILVNSKFNAMRNYSNFIHPGDQIIAVDNAKATAAVNAQGEALTVVYANSSTEPATVTVDLAGFESIGPGASATVYASTQPADSTLEAVKAAGVVPQTPVAVDGEQRNVTVTLPAQSVSTIVVDAVAGVSDQAPGPRDGQTYLLKGQGSGLFLSDGGDPEADNVLQIHGLGEAPAGALAQAWTFYEVDTSSWNQPQAKAFVLQNGSGQFLTATSDGTSLETLTREAAAANPNAVWVASTTNGRDFGFMNKAVGQSLDVNGQATAAGTTVGVWTFSGGSHQYWSLASVVPTSVEAQVLATPVGVAPTLPATATPVYSFGPGAPGEIVWEVLPAETWAVPGAVEVTGAGVDLWGSQYTATARVLVGPYTQTDPARLKVAAGASLADLQALAPADVPVRVGALDGTVEAPVVWDFSALDDSSLSVGDTLVAVPGAVASNTASDPDLPAWLYVTTFAGSAPIENLCTSTPSHVSSVAAHYTEGSYAASRTCDGSLSTNWSNWRSSGYSSGTLTYTLDAAYLLGEVRITPVERAPLTVTVEVNASASGSSGWTETSAGSVDGWSTDLEKAVAFDPVEARRVRLTMTLDNYTKIAEVEIEAVSLPTSVAALGDLRLGGVSIDGFDPDTLTYEVVGTLADLPPVTGIAADLDAQVSVAEATDPDRVEVTVTAEDRQAQAVYTVLLAAPAPRLADVPVTVGVRCLASKAYLTVVAQNGEDIPLGVEFATSYGTKAFASVAVDKYASHAFTTRLAKLPAGQVQVTLTGVDASGEPIGVERAVPYSAATC